ncbi:ABC transporter ATP-binding protein [Camelliibacillus cellulosilyticus]|uniref:ABC transporter ATP-binding protein n=1 Tax=Camelliibacillus cellulosilyticus TaxID=2174486 RepID=A0ABV9GJ02_9BACL
MEAAVSFRNVCKGYKDFEIKNITFDVPKGFITGLVGPNGAGKTTLIKMILAAAFPSSGEIKVLGAPVDDDHTEVRDRIGFVYDDICMVNHLKAEKMKKLIAPFYTQWDEALFQSYAQRFELPLKKRLTAYSKGMRMKFALAVALSHHADLIVMDEPTSGLDPVFRRELLDILSDLMTDEGKTIIYSTHHTTELDRVADFVTFIQSGQLVFSLAKDDLFERYQLVKGPKRSLEKAKNGHLIGIRETGIGFEALTDRADQISNIEGLLFEEPTIEDIMYYYKKGADNGASD